MVKISIKKEEKTIKARQKQKQRQSQRVVVNIGKDALKPKRRRAPRQTLQKSKSQITPTQINVPQALPIQIQPQPQQQSMNELIKYLKENEKQKEIIKEKDQTINELEKDKKDRDRSKDLTKEEVQEDFSRVYSNSNISSLTNSGTATPFFSKPVDPYELYSLLRREADLRGENPNSSQISVSTLTTLATNNTNQSNLSSFFDRSNRNEDLTTYMTQSPPKDPTETKMQSPYQELFEYEIEAQQVVPPEVVPANEDPIIDEILKEEEEPENKIVVFGKQRAGSTSSTGTEQTSKKNDIDNSIPAFLRPINAPLPAINMKDVIGLRPTASETKDIRQARINKLDKKPLLAIEDEPIDIPTFTADELKAYKEKTQETRQAESTTTEPEEDAEKP